MFRSLQNEERQRDQGPVIDNYDNSLVWLHRFLDVSFHCTVLFCVGGLTLVACSIVLYLKSYSTIKDSTELTSVFKANYSNYHAWAMTCRQKIGLLGWNQLHLLRIYLWSLVDHVTNHICSSTVYLMQNERTEKREHTICYWILVLFSKTWTR